MPAAAYKDVTTMSASSVQQPFATQPAVAAGLPAIPNNAVSTADAVAPEWLFRGSVPCLDGLRAVSVILVILFHAIKTHGFPSSPIIEAVMGQGAIGVDFFFAISGFLITLLLLREWAKTGSVSLKAFYTRRALRIAPAYVLFVVALLALTRFNAVAMTGWDWLSIATYTVNYNDGRLWEFGHLWTLSIEEQFYFLWPFLLLTVGPKRCRGVLLAYLLAAPVFRLLARVLFPHYPSLYYCSTFARMDSIAAGCLLALFAFDPGLLSHIRVGGQRAWVLAALACCALIGSLCAAVQWPAYGVTLAHSVNALAITAIVWVTVNHSGSFIGRILSWKATAAVGVLSYSLYLWQQLFLNPQNSSWACRWPVNVILAAGAAAASYVLVESPFLRLKNRLSGRAVDRAGLAAEKRCNRHRLG
jgi:peptidoglycan/LPS O-acetylase OafA/YrhL